MDQIGSNREILHFTVAIIGGGFTGATLAAQLLRRSGGTSVVLIEKAARVGRGVAYGTQCQEHLLNVPAGNMSAYPDNPEHFLRWARLNHDPGVKSGDFLPRPVYGRYAASVLQHEVELHPSRFERVQDEAISVARVGDLAEIRLRSGQALSANMVVLALGNFPPGDPRLPGKTPHSQRYVSNPWTARIPNDGIPHKSVLLVGSGLTSVDIVIALRTRGFGGAIHILSRRGLLPQTHKAAFPWPTFWNERSPRTVSGLLRSIRTQVEAAERQGSDWRAVIDSLRPVTQEIWRSLSLQAQCRFLRHARPYWDVHRHRVAPEIGATLASELMKGRTQIHAGRITEYSEDADGVDVAYRDRKSGEVKRLRVDCIINCTGPESDCRKLDNPLLTNLVRQKLVRPDQLFLGLDISTDGALIDANGVASDFLYTIGPSRKGSSWETTAIPEIRVHVAELAKFLLSSRNREETESTESDAAPDLQSALR
jgi:uncharacterized NAD(P)/FAD-binding protein YdhS